MLVILGTREFTSCPSSGVTPPAVLLTLVPSLVEIQSQLKQQMQTLTVMQMGLQGM